MKEYDLDSYSRKWRQTHGIYSTAKDELKQGTFTEFFEIDRSVLGVEIDDGKGSEKRCVLERTYDDYDMVKIEYYPIESGWYTHRSGVALLVRKHLRGFQQGLSHNTHDLTIYDPTGRDRSHDWAKFGWCDFLKRPEFVKLSPDKPFGVMNERLWWKDGLLFFLYRTIGHISGNRVMLESRAFAPYVRPFVEDTCQIVSS